MSLLSFVVASLLRNPRRTGAYLVGTVLAVGLISSVLFFIALSAGAMTTRATGAVHVDLQVVVNNSHDTATPLRAAMARRAGVASAQRFALASFAGASVHTPSHIGQTAAGKIVAIDPSYLAAIGAPSLRQGSFAKHGVVISLDLGTNLGARVGDTITLTLGKGIAPVRLPITGIASMTNSDVLFAPLDPVLRLNPFNPPANVVLVDYGLFERTMKPAILAHAPASTSGSFVQRQGAPVSEQVHVALKRSLIPSDPTQAKTFVAQLRREIELTFAGRVTVVDNLGAALDQAQADILWAEAIFVFLALPGVVLATGLSRYVTATVIEAHRREFALLRLRGAGPKHVLTILGSTLLVVALLGAVIGIVTGWITTRIASGTTLPLGGPLGIRSLLLSFVAAIVLGFVTTLWPLMGVTRTSFIDSRRRVGREKSPLWARLYLDVLCLVIAFIVYEVSQRNGGFQPVLNAEGNPTISLSVFTFVAPLFFWIGAILLLVRVSRGLVSKSGQVLERLFARRVVGELAARTMRRRSGSLHQAMVLVAMAITFAGTLLIFVQTYNQQQRVDAELTLGADVKVTVANRAQSSIVAQRLAVPGVATVTPFRTTVAYVGSEIQDIFGIQVPSFRKATRVTDTFFVGANAATTLHALQTTPNGIVVSQETARDYSLSRGDTLLLRLYNSTKHRYVAVHFRLVGVAREFATAPKDAFLVTNLSYLQSVTGGGGVNIFLVRTSSQSQAVAAQLRSRFANGPLVHIDDLTGVQQRLSTSLTSLNLTGLTGIDYGYTVIMIVTALLVFSLAVLLERSRDFAMLRAMGASTRQVRGLLLAEVSYVVITGCIFGLIVGFGFAEMLIQILAAIFDPPPDAIAVPWSGLAVLLAITLSAALIASLSVSQRLVRLNLAQTLRET
jgi:putative ABC transport system permease protein